MKMGPMEFADKMRAIAERAKFDEEIAHCDADDLLCDLLVGLGYGVGVEIFRSMPKWYA